MLKEELFDCNPASISPVAATDGTPVAGASAGSVLVEPFDSNDELAELIRASRASRSARRTSVNLSNVAKTPSLSFLASCTSAYAKLRRKLVEGTENYKNCWKPKAQLTWQG